MRILQERQISACECVYRLCHLQLKASSRKCIFLNTRKPEQRYRVLRFDKSDQVAGHYDNIFGWYEKRPLHDLNFDFQNMSLLQFAMFFEPDYFRRNENNDEESDDADALMSEEPSRNRHKLTLTDGTKMSIRKTPAVVRAPFFMVGSDPENFYYSLLLPYLPFRNENKLLEGFDSAKEAF